MAVRMLTVPFDRVREIFAGGDLERFLLNSVVKVLRVLVMSPARRDRHNSTGIVGERTV